MSNQLRMRDEKVRNIFHFENEGKRTQYLDAPGQNGQFIIIPSHIGVNPKGLAYVMLEVAQWSSYMHSIPGTIHITPAH